MFIGVDGCKQGWVAVALRDGAFLEARVFSAFRELASHYAEARAIGVDMPIGLVRKGGREADESARKFLTGQASSVFSAPVASVLSASDYAEAGRLSRRDAGKGLSRQSFGLVDKIREIADVLAETPGGEARARPDVLYEVHPEISFRLMNDCEPLAHRKKTWGGLGQRLGLLEAKSITLPRRIDGVGDVGIDDVVDAAAAAWSARRIGTGKGRSFPEHPTQRDAHGRLIVIRG